MKLLTYEDQDQIKVGFYVKKIKKSMLYLI